MDRLKTIERWLGTAEKGLLIAIVSVMVVLSFTQLILREFFSAGLLWADTFLRHLVLWVGFFGAGIAAIENKQFAMDAAARVFTGRTKAAVGIAANLFTSIVCVLLTRASLRFLKDEFAAASILFSIGELHVPGWIFETILPAGFALLAVHYLIKLAENVLELRSK